MYLLLALLLQFIPPVRTGVAGDRSATIAPKPIAFPSDASWQRAATPHFDIISAAGERRTREIGVRLETLAAALSDLRPDSANDARARVLLFGKRRDAQPYFDVLTNRSNSHVTGLFVAQRDRGAMIIDASRENASDRTPYHELVHYLLASNSRRLPLWLEEGLAEFYSNAQLGRGELTVGYLIPEHMQLLARRVPLPVSKLFALKFESEAAAQSIFYAQSWAAVDYLIRNDRNAFRAFVNDLANGTDADAALRARFKLDARDLAHVFAAYAIYERTPLAIA